MQNTAVQLMTGRLECQSVVMPVTQQTKRNKANLHAKHEIPKHVSQKEKMKTRINTRGGNCVHVGSDSLNGTRCTKGRQL